MRVPGRTALIGIVGVALVVAACGAPGPTAVPVSPEAVATPASPEAVATPSTATPPTATPPTAALPSATPPTATPPTASPAAGVPVQDPDLLAVLPPDIDGVPVELESIAFAEAVADPGFAANVASAAFAVAVSGDDLASAVVAAPHEGAWSEAWFRDWRDSYNDGACAQAGGVAGNAEAELSGRTVHIGTCAGGLRTYHAWMEDRGLLVSAFSVGEARFGERLMAGLRP